MAVDLRTKFLGFEVKNPVGVSSCDFGGEARLTKRVAEQGIGWIVGKTVHKIDGPHRWPRPYFYSLRRFGSDLKDSWICSQMFHNMPYEEWLEKELPKILKVCEEHDVLFIGSMCGIGTDPETWVPILKDLESAGVKLIELDTGGPHATFGAVAAQKDVGAPLALDPDKAYKLTKACVEAVKVPLIFKMTPQCVNMAAVALAVERAGAAAISANNAFYGCWIDHETGTFYGIPAAMGGLPGRAWQLVSLAKLLEVTATVNIPVIGIGGAFTYDDVVRYMMAGSDLVGICSAIYSRGVKVLNKIITELAEWMEKKGYSSVDELKRKVVKDFMYLRDWPREKVMAKHTPIVPKFYSDKCTRCGICVELCPYGALSLDKDRDKVPQFAEEYCMGCGWCVGHCPSHAIDMVHKRSGQVVWDGYGVIKKWIEEFGE